MPDRVEDAAVHLAERLCPRAFTWIRRTGCHDEQQEPHTGSPRLISSSKLATMATTKDKKASPIDRMMTSGKTAPVAVLIIVGVALYLSDVPNFWRSQDEKCYMWLAQNILQGHGLTIDLPLDVDRSFLWGMTPLASPEGAFAIKYPVGQSYLLATAMGLGGEPFAFYIVPVLGLLTAFCLSLTMYITSRSLRLSLLAAALLVACPTWLIHSRSLLSDVSATATIYGALLLCILGNSARRSSLHFVAGLFLAGGIVIRYPTVLAVFPVALLLLGSDESSRTRWLNIALMVLPCLAAIALLLYLNQRLFGHPWTTGYAAIGEKGFRAGSFVGNLVNYLTMSCVLLPGAGVALFWYAIRSTQRIARRYLRPFVLVPLLYIVFYSIWGNLAQLTYERQDLLVLGPRLMLPAVPALAFLLSLGVDDVCKKLRMPPWTPWLIPLGLAVIGLGVRCVFEQRTNEYAAANTFMQRATPHAGLILLKPHWFKIIWPHGTNVCYSALNGHHVSAEQDSLIAKYHQLEKPIYIVLDPYQRLGIPDPSWRSEAILSHLRLRGKTREGCSIDNPFEIKVFNLLPGW